jgi:hypothetical protein
MPPPCLQSMPSIRMLLSRRMLVVFCNAHWGNATPLLKKHAFNPHVTITADAISQVVHVGRLWVCISLLQHSCLPPIGLPAWGPACPTHARWTNCCCRSLTCFQQVVAVVCGCVIFYVLSCTQHIPGCHLVKVSCLDAHLGAYYTSMAPLHVSG